jgi:sialate O-acetylesterase
MLLRSVLLLLSVYFTFQANSLFAAVKLPGFYSSHMVMQRDVEMPIWGWATPGEKVTVKLGEQVKTITTPADGKWQVKFDKLALGAPITLTVQGENTIALEDILVGDVWLCSGQSNMEWVVYNSTNAPAEIAAANYPEIRHIKIPRQPTAVAKDNIAAAQWQVCSPQTVGGFTAAGYFMARKLQKELHVPIGLINSSWGGTRIEPWTAPEGFAQVPELKSIEDSVNARTAGSKDYEANLNKYLQSVEKWTADAKKTLAAGGVVGAAPTFPDTLKPLEGHQDPVALYNGMIKPFVGFPIKGAIWYQGESNMGEGMTYMHKMEALIKGWRTVWKQDDMPFYFVQIAPYKYGTPNQQTLAEFWEAQAAAADKIPNTGMIVINDKATIGDIHPPYKQEVGDRLAFLALNRTYGRKEFIDSGPTFKELKVESGQLRVIFNHVAEGMRSRDGKPLSLFEIIGPGTGWHPATAVIDGDSVILSSPEVKEPTAMRFAWNQLAEPNLENSAGLPTSAFRAGEIPATDATKQVKEIKDYELVYDLDLSKLGPQITYNVDQHDAVKKPITRIAYLVELESNQGQQQFMYVSMDAFTKDLTKIGIPTFKSGARFQQKVTNMNVVTNVDGLLSGEKLPGGNIEFWPNNYAMPNTGSVPNASNEIFDHGDQYADPADGYGSMQIHNAEASQTLFAINHWVAGTGADIGIGNSTTQHKDWTFTGSAGNYLSKRLRVYVKTN